MLEKYLYDYLGSALDVPVYMEVPKTHSGSFVVIERTGGGSTERIRRGVVAIQSYADSMYGAASLNERVIDAMDGAVSVDEITAVRLNSDYNYTNPETKEYRYQAVFEVTFYEEAV